MYQVIAYYQKDRVQRRVVERTFNKKMEAKSAFYQLTGGRKQRQVTYDDVAMLDNAGNLIAMSRSGYITANY